MPINPDRLKKARINKSLSPQEAADTMGVDLHTYLKYEAGKEQPNAEILSRMSDLVEVTPEYLLNLVMNSKDILKPEDLTRFERWMIGGYRLMNGIKDYIYKYFASCAIVAMGLGILIGAIFAVMARSIGIVSEDFIWISMPIAVIGLAPFLFVLCCYLMALSDRYGK